MSVSEGVALRAALETMKREKEATQAELARVRLEKEASDAENWEHGMRLRRERSWGTSFDRQAVIIQLIDEELLCRLWAPCGHVG